MWFTRELVVELSVSVHKVMEGRGHGERIHFCGRQRRAAGHNIRPRLSLSLRRLDRAPRRTWFDPPAAPRRGSCHRGGWYLRHARGVRTHETRPKARRVRGFSHGWPVAFAAVRGCADRRDRRAGRNAFPGFIDRVLSLRPSTRATD